MSYDRKLPDLFPYHVDLPTDVQVALVVGWILAAGTAFAVTPNIRNHTYRLWMSEASYKDIAQKIDSHVLG